MVGIIHIRIQLQVHHWHAVRPYLQYPTAMADTSYVRTLKTRHSLPLRLPLQLSVSSVVRSLAAVGAGAMAMREALGGGEQEQRTQYKTTSRNQSVVTMCISPLKTI
jgi:hypothetical protein